MGCCLIRADGCDVAIRSSMLTLCLDLRQAALFRLLVVNWAIAQAQQG